MINWKLSALIILTFAFISCDDDSNEPSTIDAPAQYEFERNGQNTVSFSGQTTRILMGQELVSEIKNSDATLDHLLAMFRNEDEQGGDVSSFSDESLNNSTKSIKSKTAVSADYFAANTASSAQIKEDFESWINAQVTEVFPAYSTLAEPGIPGQIADGSSVRYVNGFGLEYDQLVNKSLIGALMVDQMLNNYLSPAVLDAGSNVDDNDNQVTADDKYYTSMEHKWDEAYGYLFGLSQDPAQPLATLGEDSFLNKYLKRVEDDPDFTGIAQRIFDAFKLGRAAIVAGDYNLRDDQARIIRQEISKVIGIRAVYNLESGRRELFDGTAPNYGSAFHDISEGYGFIYSLAFTRNTETQAPFFTYEEVQDMLSKFEINNGLWDVSETTLVEMAQDISNRMNLDFNKITN